MRILALVVVVLGIGCRGDAPPTPTGLSPTGANDALDDLSAPPDDTASVELRELLAGQGPAGLSVTQADSLRRAVVDPGGRYAGLHGIAGPGVRDDIDFDGDSRGDLTVLSASRTGFRGVVYLRSTQGYRLAGRTHLASVFAVCPRGDGTATVTTFEEDYGAGEGDLLWWSFVLGPGRVERIEDIRLNAAADTTGERRRRLKAQVEAAAAPCRVYDSRL